MTVKSRFSMLRVLKDFLVGLAIFAAVSVVTLADALAEVLATGAHFDAFPESAGAPFMLTTLAVVFSSMLAFGLWFLRHAADRMVKARPRHFGRR